MVFIVVDPPAVKKWLADNNLKVEITDELMNDEALKKAVMKSIIDIAKENNFNSLEKPKQIKLIKDMWTIESDMLTPTMKTKRNIAKTRYSDDIVALYEAGPFGK